jgi:hypothetical protein
MRALIVNWLLDRIWDVTLPLASPCSVCAFWRGVAVGTGVSALAMVLA